MVLPRHIGCASFAGLFVMLRATDVFKSNSHRSGAHPPRYRFQLRKSCDIGMYTKRDPSGEKVPNSPYGIGSFSGSPPSSPTR